MPKTGSPVFNTRLTRCELTHRVSHCLRVLNSSRYVCVPSVVYLVYLGNVGSSSRRFNDRIREMYGILNAILNALLNALSRVNRIFLEFGLLENGRSFLSEKNIRIAVGVRRYKSNYHFPSRVRPASDKKCAG